MTLAATKTALTDLLGVPINAIEAVGGGDINCAARIVANGQTLFVKWPRRRYDQPDGWPSMFAAEAHALASIASTATIRVPVVIAYTNELLVLEWIESGPADAAVGERLGRQLAALHRATAPAFGYDSPNFCGATPQPNPWTASWTAFFRDARLGWQRDLAIRNGLLPRDRCERLERVMARLDHWIDDRAVVPSLIHGDLWGGNWLADDRGAPVLIDPACAFCDRELELALCRLFGGFPRSFYAAYDESYPPLPGRDDRIALYQLYHVLNHLNLFGESYSAHVDAILRRYG